MNSEGLLSNRGRSDTASHATTKEKAVEFWRSLKLSVNACLDVADGLEPDTRLPAKEADPEV